MSNKNDLIYSESSLQVLLADERKAERARIREGAVERVVSVLDAWDFNISAEAERLLAARIVDAVLGVKP